MSTTVSQRILVGAALSAALAVWAGVLYMGMHVRAAEIAWAHERAAARQAADTQGEAARLRALLADTALARAVLDAASHADIIETAKLIESVGKIAGARVRVAGVSPAADTAARDVVAATGIHAASFAVEAHGTFAQVVAALRLLETLPAPAYIEQFSLARETDTADAKRVAGVWALSVRIRVLTTASLSSS